MIEMHLLFKHFSFIWFFSFPAHHLELTKNDVYRHTCLSVDKLKLDSIVVSVFVLRICRFVCDDVLYDENCDDDDDDEKYLGFAKDGDGLAESFPGRFVQCSVPVLVIVIVIILFF